MPMPKPKKNEKEDEFINRCMGDEVMKDEFEDNKKRLAVCYDIWRKAKEEKNMSNERQYRAFPFMELRVEDGDKPMIKGHAAVFDKLSVNLGGFREKISPGAFARTIEKGDVRALWNHNPDYLLGRTKSKTLSLAEDDRGLTIEIDPPNTQYARDFMETIKRGDVDQMSFAFATVKDSWEHKEGEESIRTLVEVELFDVSPVTFAAYPQTDVKIRSVFTEAGLNFDELTALLVRASKNIPLTDADYDLLTVSIGVLNGYLPIEELDGQGASDNEGHVERLKAERWRLEFDSKKTNGGQDG